MKRNIDKLVNRTAVAVLAACVMLAGPTSRAASPDSGGAVPQPQARFSVVQWNIGHFALGKASATSVTAEESAARSAEYRAMIARLKPDFLGVSEFDPVFDKAGRLTTNEVFAAFPTKVLGPKNNYQCNALFTRFPCVRHEIVDYTLRRQKVYFIDSVFRFGTNEVHFVQSHLDWFRTKDGQRYALPQMRQIVEHFKNVPYVIVSADFNVSEIGHFAAFTEAGYTVANNGRYAVLDNVVVKGFDVKELFSADDERRLSDHRIVGCVLEMKPPVLCSADTPIAASVFKTFPDHASVYGVHLSPIAVDGPDRVAGLSFGGVNSLVTRELRGLQLSGIASWGHPDGPKETMVYGGQIAGAFTGTDRLVGIQVAGIFSGADDMTGIQLSGLSSAAGNHGIRGVQIAGLLAQSQTCAGLQMALWNGSESMCGVQLGLMNFAVPAENGFVIQIGLVNGIGRDEKAGWSGMRIIPIINASW